MTLRGIALISAATLAGVGLVGRQVFGGVLFGIVLLTGLLYFVLIWIVWGARTPRSYPTPLDLKRADQDEPPDEPPIVPTNLPGPS